MKPITIDKLPEYLETLLAEIATTGDRLEFDWKGKRFQIFPVQKKSNLDNLVAHPEVYIGDPDDLVNISWEHEINLDLP